LVTAARSGTIVSQHEARTVHAFETPLPIVSPEGIGGEEFIGDVRKILESRQLTNGKFVREFERAAASYLGAPHCVAVSSCTSGLVLTLAALGLKGEVILPSFTFHATAHAVAWNGLKPVFVDCEPDTFCIGPQAVRERISQDTAAILAVHIFGNPASVFELEEIADGAGIPLIYDSAHAFGSKAGATPVGGFGAAEIFSLSPTKLLVAGEGGLVATRDASLAKRVRAVRNYGDAGDSDPELRGLNARMSEFHAALAIRGLAGLDKRIERRNQIRVRYEKRLGGVGGISFQQIRPGNLSSCKDFQILVEAEAFGCSRDWILDALRQRNIEARRYFWPPVHRQKLYAAVWDGRPLPVTDHISNRILSLPIYSSLGDDKVDTVCDAILAAPESGKARGMPMEQSA
jgi:dTDP-4-amino-4,6-dideoxygalactose transaminase